MQALFEVIVPVFLLVGFGYLATWRKWIGDDAIDGLMRFAQSFAVPCLLFQSIARLDLGANFDPGLLVSFYAGALASFALGYAGARRIFGRNPVDAVAIGFVCLFPIRCCLAFRSWNAPTGPMRCRATSPSSRSMRRCSMRSASPPWNSRAAAGPACLRAGWPGRSADRWRATPGHRHRAWPCGQPRAGPDARTGDGRGRHDGACGASGGAFRAGRGAGPLSPGRRHEDDPDGLRAVASGASRDYLGSWSARLRPFDRTAALGGRHRLGRAGGERLLFSSMYGAARRVAASSVLIGTGLAMVTVWFWLSVLP